MNYVANYYVKSNFLPISNCISNRIEEGEDYTCDSAIVKNFLDTAAEEPYNLFQTVEQYKNDLKDLEKKNKKLENDLKVSDSLNTQLHKAVDNLIARQPVMNGGIVKSPDEKYLLGLIVQPLDPKDKDKYPALSKRGDKQKDFQTISIMTNRKLRRKLGIIESVPHHMEDRGYNTEGDTMIGDYGIAFVGHNISKDPSSVYDQRRDTQINIKNENLHKWAGKFPVKKKDSFIDIPKKSNGMVYVILITVCVFLYFKIMKKI
tara:strand:- start:148 stop:930 length:783 start_codon:yes stop_codon:yes gene_type:complete